jgi:hypothetical protein
MSRKTTKIAVLVVVGLTIISVFTSVSVAAAATGHDGGDVTDTTATLSENGNLQPIVEQSSQFNDHDAETLATSIKHRTSSSVATDVAFTGIGTNQKNVEVGIGATLNTPSDVLSTVPPPTTLVTSSLLVLRPSHQFLGITTFAFLASEVTQAGLESGLALLDAGGQLMTTWQTAPVDLGTANSITGLALILVGFVAATWRLSRLLETLDLSQTDPVGDIPSLASSSAGDERVVTTNSDIKRDGTRFAVVPRTHL